MTQVIVNPGVPFDLTLKQFGRKVQQSGVFAEARRRRHYETPQANYASGNAPVCNACSFSAIHYTRAGRDGLPACWGEQRVINESPMYSCGKYEKPGEGRKR